ncbi:flavin reductase family protein, partial [Streptomyces xanthochromogenes]
DSARPGGAEGFAGRPWRPAAHSGAPVLLDGVASFDCSLAATCPAGDHTVLIGRVEAFEELSQEPALLFSDSRLAAAPVQTPDRTETA